MTMASLGYLHFTSTDLPAWHRFGTGVIGAMEVPGPDGHFGLKIDDHPHRLLIEAGEADRLSAIGWEMASQAAYEALRETLTAAGIDISEGDAQGAAKRSVSAYFAVRDPAENPLEFYWQRTDCGAPFRSPIGVPGFVTGDMGLGHIVIPVPGTLQQAHDFYTATLGLGDSDDLTIAPPAEGFPSMRVLFLHADNPRHHSLALFDQPSPGGIVHFMLELSDIDEVGRCLDRVTAHGLPLMATLGRHCNDNMLSFYVYGPGGAAVEIGCEGLQVDWAGFTPTISTTGDHWGHAYRQLAT